MTFRFPTAPVWSFNTGRFLVTLNVERLRGYEYDGDDEDGETQDKLDSGEYVAFGSLVRVELDGVEIATDYLYGSVYAADEVPEFWQAHRCDDPDNRNTLAMAARGICIGHYFPDMVRTAIRSAREHVRAMPVPPRIRESAK
jgi:hypothetical protein